MRYKKQWMILGIFLILFFTFIYPLSLDNIHQWDEGRHSVASHVYLEYIETIISDGYISWGDFAETYEQHMPGAFGWYTGFDPPAYHIFQSLFFLVFGAGYLTSRLTTGALILLGAPVLFLLSSKILKSKTLGVMTVSFYLLSPISIWYSPMTILAIPISFSMVAWYYFTFHRESKYFTLKYGDKKLKINRNYIYGGFFLSIATMMKYQAMIFYAGFWVAYFIYLIATKKNAEAKELFIIGIVQSIIFFLVCGLWVKYIFTSGVWKRIWYEGSGKERTASIFFYFIDTFKQTLYLAIFSFIPLLFKKGRRFYKKNARLVIWILSVLFIGTILIKNMQLRYLIHFVPFLFILIVRGLNDLCRWMGHKDISRVILATGITALLVFSAYGQLTETKERYGVQNYELMEYQDKISDPKLLLYIHTPKNLSTGYYPNPDEWMFGTQITNKEHNPEKMGQFMKYIYWSTAKSNPDALISSIDEWNTQIPTYVIVPKYRTATKIIDGKLSDYNKDELTWYNVYWRKNAIQI